MGRVVVVWIEGCSMWVMAVGILWRVMHDGRWISDLFGWVRLVLIRGGG